jgi:hypothetical protein
MVVECSNFESMLELATQDSPPRIVNPLLELRDAVVHCEVHQHVLGKQAGVGVGTRLFPFPR